MLPQLARASAICLMFGSHRRKDDPEFPLDSCETSSFATSSCTSTFIRAGDHSNFSTRVGLALGPSFE